MAKYLVVASYGPEGVRGVLQSGCTARTEVVRNAVENLGGSVESFYFAFGEADAYVVVDLPNNVTAAALSLAVSSSGVVSTRVVVLLTPAEIDEAARVEVRYTPPGG